MIKNKKWDKNQKKWNKKEINSRVNLLNKRDQIDEYIFNSVTNYNEYLLSKNNDKITDNLNSLIQDQEDFLVQTKIYLKKVETMEAQILDKKNDFVNLIKNYADGFVKKEKSISEKLIVDIESVYNNEVKAINDESKKIENEKNDLQSTKNLNVKKVKSTINKIQKEIDDDKKFNLDVENQEIINLTSSHKKFIINEVKLKINDLNNRLEKLNNHLTKVNLKKIKDVYRVTIDSKNKIKNEFLFLADIEKISLRKIIKFKDFLEDIKYFASDKIEKYKVLIANGKVIKAENFKNLMKDTNHLLSFISNSESIFDNANFLISNVKKKLQDSSINDKLAEFKNSLLNSNSMKLFKSKDSKKGDL